MKKLIPLAFLLMLAPCLSAQHYIQYHNLCNQAFKDIEMGYYVPARDSILKAFGMVEHHWAADEFALAKCLSQVGSKDSTMFYLRSALSKDRRARAYFKVHDEWFMPILGEAGWHDILQTPYEPHECTPEQRALSDRFNSMAARNQHHRKILYDSIYIYYPTDTALQNLYRDSIAQDDVIMQTELDQIMDSIGFPGGPKSCWNTAAEVCLSRVDTGWFARKKEQLLQEVDLGTLSPQTYARIADKYRMRKGLPSMYGRFQPGSIEQGYPYQVMLNCRTIGACTDPKFKIQRLYWR